MLLRLAAVALALAFGHAGTAAAQSEVTVAGGSPGPTLQVADADARYLDVTLQSTGEAEPDLDFERDDPPLWPDEAIVATLAKDGAGGASVVSAGGAVSAAAATVEVGFRGGHVLSLPALAGEAYTGRHAGRVRFFLGTITLPDGVTDDDPVSVRMLDASGAVIGVAASPDAERREVVLRRRAGGALVRIQAVLTSRLDAVALAPEHRSDELCLRVAVRSAADTPEVACEEAGLPMTLGGRRGCGRVPTTLAGFVPAASHSVVVRLGSGRTVTLATRPAPFGRPVRMVAAVLPRGEAVRSAGAVDIAERVLVRGRVLVAPPDRRCERNEDWSFFADPPAPRRGTPPGTEVAAALASNGGPRLLVRDAGEQLCANFDALDLDGGDCFDPPFSARFSDLYIDPARGIVAGLFPAQVATVRLRFRGGGGELVPATEGLGYTGRYRTAVHFAFAPLRRGKVVTGATLLDTGGRAIGRASADGPGIDRRVARRPSPVLAAGGERLFAGALAAPQSSRRHLCIGIERDDCRDDHLIVEANTATALVRCDRRRTVVFGVTRRAVTGVEITLAGGRRIPARTAAIPSGLGRRGKLFLAVLPRREAVTGVRLGAGGTIPLPGRAPARQCGYEAQGFVQ
jgi:hypothetical protein